MTFLEKIKNKNVKISIAILVIAALGLGGFALAKGKDEKDSLEAKNIIETYTIADNEKVFVNGVIIPTKSKDFNPHAQGEVSKMNATNGKIVNEGELLYTIKNQSILDEVESLKSQIEALKKANIENDPMINAEISKLEGQISVLNKKALVDTKAPFAGKIYINDTIENQENSLSTMTLLSNEFYMKGQVNEQDLPKLQIDDPVDILILSTNKKVTGRISYISDRPSTLAPEVNVGNQGSLSYYDINISFDSQENLINGFHAQASIEIKNSLCKIPSSAILRDENEKPYVFEVLNGILKKQIVEIKSQNEEFTVIKGGLDKKDIIIRYPATEMKEGDAIPTDYTLEESSQESEGK